MTIYVDVLLIENFIINLFLLMITMRLLRLDYRKSIYVSALIGTIYTLVMFLPQDIINSMALKIIIVILMITITLEIKSISNIIKSTLAFFLISFTLCGLCFGLVLMQNEYILGEKFSISKSSIKYILLALMLLYIISTRIITYLEERALIKNLIYDIEISYNNQILYVKGFLDTGNELREPVTNLPCIIVESEYLRNIKLKGDNIFYIGYETIGEYGHLEGFKGERVRVKSENQDWRTIEAIICACNRKLSVEDEYNALLSRGII